MVNAPRLMAERRMVEVRPGLYRYKGYDIHDIAVRGLTVCGQTQGFMLGDCDDPSLDHTWYPPFATLAAAKRGVNEMGERPSTFRVYRHGRRIEDAYSADGGLGVLGTLVARVVAYTAEQAADTAAAQLGLDRRRLSTTGSRP